MTKLFKRNALYPLCILAAALACGSANAGPIGEWTYKIVDGSIGSFVSTRPGFQGNSSAVLKLYNDGNGGYSVKLVGYRVDDCFKNELAATVDKVDGTTMIVPAPRMATCARIRLVIKDDGSGGQVQVNNAPVGQPPVWTTDTAHDYGLTPA